MPIASLKRSWGVRGNHTLPIKLLFFNGMKFHVNPFPLILEGSPASVKYSEPYLHELGGFNIIIL